MRTSNLVATSSRRSENNNSSGRIIPRVPTEDTQEKIRRRRILRIITPAPRDQLLTLRIPFPARTPFLCARGFSFSPLPRPSLSLCFRPRDYLFIRQLKRGPQTNGPAIHLACRLALVARLLRTAGRKG